MIFFIFFAEEINATIIKLIHLKFLLKAVKIFLLTFSKMHLLHRLYGVDVPGSRRGLHNFGS